jgi:tetratricopeptide (TPR) repeat protein
MRSSQPRPAARPSAFEFLVRATALSLLLVVASCAPKLVEPPAAVTPYYPDFVFPEIPAGVSDARVINEHNRGWRFLQANDLRQAEREFVRVLRRIPDFPPAETAMGYVGLARGDHRSALAHFDRALKRSETYLPALLGRGDTLLASGQVAEALDSFQTALAVDDSLVNVRQRVEVLRARALQELVGSARRWAAAGSNAEAREAYGRAIAASPDSAFLYRELGVVERRQGYLDAALSHFRRAEELDPSDARSLAFAGEIHEGRGDYESAADAYSRALAIEPLEGIAPRLERVRREMALARLPGEYRLIPDSPQITRGELAALIGIGLERLLLNAPTTHSGLITDARGHWASGWILTVVRHGVLEPYPNHTFQPGAVVRRIDLANATSRILNILGGRRPALQAQWASSRPTIADIGPGHLSYDAVSLAVGSGVMSLLEGSSFGLFRPVSGREAVTVIQKLQELADEGTTVAR